MSPPIVFIHGTNAGPWTLSNFSTHFADLGFECHSPAYRDHDPSPTIDDAARLVGTSIADYVDDIARAVAGLAEPPILVGHSLGGVVAQKLASRGLARAIVLLNGSVNWGVLPTTREERELARAFIASGAFWEQAPPPDFDTMMRFGLNKLAPRDRRDVFDRLGPESGRVLFELFFWMFDEHETTRIDYDACRCPVLMVSGSDDLAIPPSTARLIAARYGDRATFHEAKGHGHYLMLEAGWREIAERCATWIEAQVGRTSPA